MPLSLKNMGSISANPRAALIGKLLVVNSQGFLQGIRATEAPRPARKINTFMPKAMAGVEKIAQHVEEVEKRPRRPIAPRPKAADPTYEQVITEHIDNRVDGLTPKVMNFRPKGFGR